MKRSYITPKIKIKEIRTDYLLDTSYSNPDSAKKQPDEDYHLDPIDPSKCDTKYNVWSLYD